MQNFVEGGIAQRIKEKQKENEEITANIAALRKDLAHMPATLQCLDSLERVLLRQSKEAMRREEEVQVLVSRFYGTEAADQKEAELARTLGPEAAAAVRAGTYNMPHIFS